MDRVLRIPVGVADLLPPLTGATLTTAVLAGAAADITWEGWARLVTPLLVGGPLQPASLVQSVFGFQSWFWGETIHALGGGRLLPSRLPVHRPAGRAYRHAVPAGWVVGLGFGAGLWIFALYVMAHRIAGLPAFLGFIPLTWASLAGHMIFRLVTAAVVCWRETRSAWRCV